MRSDRAEDSFEHLRPLFEANPTGAAKLIAAWDGLHVETQIRILQQLDGIGYPAYLAERVCGKALDSANSYVRYLAAKGFYFSDDDSEEKKQLKRRIEEDSDPLVKYALLEQHLALFDKMLQNPQEFYSLPQEARLAKVRELRGGGETLARLIDYALSHQLQQRGISEIDLFEILSAYVARDSFKARYKRDHVSYDGYGEFLEGKDVEALWKLVPKLPEAVSHVLIENLPSEAGLSSGIPAEVIDGLTDRQLEGLLERRDLGLREFRKRLYFEDAREAVRHAAISSNFDLTPEEFARVLGKPKKEKVRALRDLSVMASELSLPVLEAIHDCLFATKIGGFASTFEDAEFAKNTVHRRLKDLRGPTRDRQIRELRLYYLARQAVPWKQKEDGYPPSGDLEFLADCAVRGDTWATYSRMSEKWARQWNTEMLERQLPSIIELDEDDLLQEPESGVAAIQANLQADLAKIARALAADSDDDGSSLPGLVARLDSDIAAAQTRLNETLQQLAEEVRSIRSRSDRHTVLSYVGLALLLLVVVILL